MAFLKVPFGGIAAMLYCVNHVVSMGEVNTMLNDIQTELRSTLQRLGSFSDLVLTREQPSLESEVALLAPASGYIQRINYGLLTRAAVDQRAVVTFLRGPGDFMLEGSAIAVGDPDGSQLSVVSIDLLRRAFRKAVRVGHKRTMHQDPEYAVQRILEIGLLATSPVINDPATMLRCVDALTACLRDILQASVYNRVHCDSEGQARVFEKNTPPERILYAGFDPLRQATKGSVELTVRVLDAITALAPFLSTPNQNLELRAQAELIADGVCRETTLRDRNAIEAAYLRARQALGSPTGKVDVSPATWQRIGLSQQIPS